MVWVRGRAYVRSMQVRLTIQPNRGTLLIAALFAAVAAVFVPALAHMGNSLPAGPPAPALLPACQVGDLPARHAGYDQWADTLLDTTRRLPLRYVPPDLVPFEDGQRRITLRRFVVPDLAAMLAAARADGVEIGVSSGYRSYQRQAAVYQQLREEHGEPYADLSAARPGHSEHQLGTTVDLKGGAEWLAGNAWRFGFVRSYPHGRSPAWTCYKPESWHYRYFGRQRAAQIHTTGLSPREWLWLNTAALD